MFASTLQVYALMIWLLPALGAGCNKKLFTIPPMGEEVIFPSLSFLWNETLQETGKAQGDKTQHFHPRPPSTLDPAFLRLFEHHLTPSENSPPFFGILHNGFVHFEGRCNPCTLVVHSLAAQISFKGQSCWRKKCSFISWKWAGGSLCKRERMKSGPEW